MNNSDKYLTVAALTKYLKYKFDNDDNLKHVFIKGEISNFKKHTTGHLYFSIKDESSKINAIMFNANARKINFEPVDGMKVLLSGRITVYEATGGYQIYVDEMIEDGVGNLYIEFEKLKEKLNKEGLFNEAHKRKIPKYPSTIGIVTASTGAAIKDILSTIKRRYPVCNTILFPSLVQGEAAKDDIVRNINLANTYDIDVLIVGRGGGSIEDLWPFNEEVVARAIYNSKVPVISAVGHEVDFTIADFVADLRAPTPTGAAEMAVPNMSDLIKYLSQLNLRLNESIYKKVNYNKLLLDSIKNSFVIKNPVIMYENKKQTVDNLMEKLGNLIKIKLDKNKTKLEMLKTSYVIKSPNVLYKDKIVKLNNLIESLELINPLSVIKRGYSIVYKDNKVISDIKSVKKNDKLDLKLSNGKLNVTVDNIVGE